MSGHAHEVDRLVAQINSLEREVENAAEVRSAQADRIAELEGEIEALHAYYMEIG